MGKQKSVWQWLSISGIIGVIAYTFHVVVGGILWEGYNHITQTISELTGSEDPHANFLRIFTTIYGICLIIFSISLYFIFKQYQVHKASKIGAILLIIMEVTSFLGYGFFPLDTSKSMNSFQNTMHMVVTAIVVISTLGSFYCIAVGLIKTPGSKKTGIFILICAIIITVAGMMTPIMMANDILLAGLTERINIFTIHIATVALSLIFLSKSNNSRS